MFGLMWRSTALLEEMRLRHLVTEAEARSARSEQTAGELRARLERSESERVEAQQALIRTLAGQSPLVSDAVSVPQAPAPQPQHNDFATMSMTRDQAFAHYLAEGARIYSGRMNKAQRYAEAKVAQLGSTVATMEEAGMVGAAVSSVMDSIREGAAWQSQ